MARDSELAAAGAAALLLLAISTDLADGPIARSRGTVSGLGGLLDHGADFLFVTLGLAGMYVRGVAPWLWLLPLFITLAFTQYVVDSFLLHRERRLRMSRLGRANGVLYFVPLVGDVAARLGLGFLVLPVLAVAGALVITTLVSMVDRLLALPVIRRTAPDSPEAGSRDRSAR
jgi:phosphatidylglycerophosphate synthase